MSNRKAFKCSITRERNKYYLTLIGYDKSDNVYRNANIIKYHESSNNRKELLKIAAGMFNQLFNKK